MQAVEPLVALVLVELQVARWDGTPHVRMPRRSLQIRRANLLAAASALGAAFLAKRFGLINTMVFTHLPSNVLLILVPLMPNLTLAVTVLLLRFAISQMDVPTGQSYTMSVVHADDARRRRALRRSLDPLAAISPLLAGYCFANPYWIDVPFFVAGA